MVNRKLPQIPKDRSISVAVASRIRNTISTPLDIEPGYRSRNRNEESVNLHNRELPEIPHTSENVYRLNSGSSLISSRSTSELRSSQEVRPKSFSNRELPEIPKDAEVNAAKILKSVHGQHSHAGSPMLESSTDSGQMLDPSRQGPLPPVPSRGNDRRESQFADRPYVRLDSFSDSNSDLEEYQSSHDQGQSNKESHSQLQVDSAEDSKDKKLSVGMLAPWKWAKMRRKMKANGESKTEDEDSDSRSDGSLKKELSSSTGNLRLSNSQNFYPMRKSTSMPIHDDKKDESQFVPLSKDYPNCITCFQG